MLKVCVTCSFTVNQGVSGVDRLSTWTGWKIINLANEVFGFNGWSSSIVSLVTDYIDFNEESKRFNVGVTAIVKVTLRDGVFHEDVGYGVLENSRSKGAALDKVCLISGLMYAHIFCDFRSVVH